MSRRHRVHAAGRRHSLTRHRFSRTGIAAHEDHRTRALTIKTNVLRRGDGDNHLGHTLQHRADASGILIEPGTHALVGKIDHGQQLTFRHQVGQNTPLFQRRIDTTRVMTTPVEQHHVAWLRALKIGHHGLKIEPLHVRGVIAIAFELQSHRTHQRDMNWPRRVTDPYRRLWRRSVKHLGTQSDRAAPTWSLYRRRPISQCGQACLTKHQRANAIQVIEVTLGRHVHFGPFFTNQCLLRLLNRLKHGAQPGFIHVNAQR